MSDLPLLCWPTRVRAGACASLASLALLGSVFDAFGGARAAEAPVALDEPTPSLLAQFDMAVIARSPTIRAMLADQPVEYASTLCQPLSRCMR